tara:strand:+ start:1061 stop:1765 length:705 start_codon:yes stop_codon:yes gene_type:complete
MTISKGIKEKLSALSDGELSDFETRRVLDEININPELREYWKKLQISKAAFKRESLDFETSDISSAVSNELGKSTSSQLILRESFLVKQKNYIGLALASCLLVLVYNVQSFNYKTNTFSELASKKISEAIASPQAMEVLNNSITGLNAELQTLRSDPKGSLRANYLIPLTGKTFNVSLSPINSSSDLSSVGASRIAYLTTKDGVFVISVSGNITAEKKLEILQNANFFANNLNK